MTLPNETDKEPFLVRNVFNPKMVKRLAVNIHGAYPKFKKDTFVNEIIEKLDSLTFSERNELITSVLYKYLPKDFKHAAEILVQAQEPEITKDGIEGYDGFIVMPQTLYIRKYGLDYFDISTNALYEMTKRFSAEFDIRAFIEKYPKKTLEFLIGLTKDKNPYVRRLASEGSRPLLPWGMKLRSFQEDPMDVLTILEKLKDDSNLMVRRSVANNLNDISKDNPGSVIAILKKWKVGASKERLWIINHSLRTLFKKGDKEALALLGFKKPEISIRNFKLTKKKITIGESVEFSFDIKSEKDTKQKLMIDYNLYFMKANSKQSLKTFKLSRKILDGGGSMIFTKRHGVQQRSTRTIYRGIHAVELQVNGVKYAKLDFNVV